MNTQEILTRLDGIFTAVYELKEALKESEKSKAAPIARTPSGWNWKRSNATTQLWKPRIEVWITANAPEGGVITADCGDNHFHLFHNPERGENTESIIRSMVAESNTWLAAHCKTAITHGDLDFIINAIKKGDDNAAR